MLDFLLGYRVKWEYDYNGINYDSCNMALNKFSYIFHNYYLFLLFFFFSLTPNHIFYLAIKFNYYVSVQNLLYTF